VRCFFVAAALVVTSGFALVGAVPARASAACVTVSSTVTCTYATVGPDTFTVPTGVTQATFDVFGAQGGAGDSAGGLGGEAVGTLSVTAGDVFQINVGGTGSPNGNGGGGGGNGGSNGGGQGGDGTHRSGAGGGGASDVRSGAFGLDDRLFVGGGGGGGAGTGVGAGGGTGGAGGGTDGIAGDDGTTGTHGAATGGGGATATGGGTGGNTAGCSANPACKGTAGVAGTGGAAPNVYSNDNGGGGGGGGGLWGGGSGGSGGGAGADSTGGSGGGGGSGFVTPSATGGSNTAAVRSGAGTVIITYTLPPKTNQTITFRRIDNKKLRSDGFNVSPSASSGLVVTLTSQTTDVCTIVGPTNTRVKLLAAGTCTIVASQSGNDTYNAAPPITRTFRVR
jgi:hypothetical protein